MNFQAEYDILTSLQSDQVLEIAFHFRDHKMKLYFAQKPEYEFLTLVCESTTRIFVRNYAVYFDNKVAQINIHWGQYITYAINLRDPQTKPSRFDDFKRKLSESIQSIKHPSREFTLSFLSDTEGIKRINKAALQSPLPEEPIYFYYVEGQNTLPHHNQTLKLLGEKIATQLIFCKRIAVFTTDITKQKSLTLHPIEPIHRDIHKDDEEQGASLSHACTFCPE